MILAHNALVIVGVWLAFGIGLTWTALYVVPGFLLTAYICFWVCILLGIASARYRDIPPIVQSLVGVLFFVTPVLWTGERLGENSDLILHLNPFAYLIAVIRDPLLGRTPDWGTWTAVCAMALALTALGGMCMALTRRKLAYWL